MSAGWKNIAVGLGSGLAVGLGFAVMRENKRSTAPATLSTEPVRLPEDHEPSILENLLSSLDLRVTDQLTDVEKRLAHLEAKVILDSGAQLHMEQRLRGDLLKELSDTSTRMADLLVETIEKRVVQRIAALEETIERQNDVIRSLRQQSNGAEENMQALVSGFGKAFQSAIEQMQSPAEAEPKAAAEDHSLDNNQLVNPKPAERSWRMPLVSGLGIFVTLAATASMVLR